MSANKRPYPQAVLKNLPEARQAAIIEYLDGAGAEKKRHSLSECVVWLKEDGVGTSIGALSSFRSWYLLRQQMAANEQAAMAMADECKQQGWVKTAADEQAAGQAFFTRLAMAQQDPEQWFYAQKIQLGMAKEQREREELTLAKDRFQRETCKLFLRWRESKKAEEIASSSSASNSDKIEKLGQLMFGEDWKS